MAFIFIHGSGHKVTSWNETLSYMKCKEKILCPNLSSILNGKEANYNNLYASFIDYCNKTDGQINLCGLSLGGVLALNYALDTPDKVKTLVLIGTPHKISKLIFNIQNIAFRFLPKSVFEVTAFSKKDMFVFGNSMKKLNFSNISDRLENVNCPTLIICGEKDRAYIKSAHYFTRNIKNAKLKIIENTGHAVNEENPKVLASILDEYYKAWEV